MTILWTLESNSTRSHDYSAQKMAKIGLLLATNHPFEDAVPNLYFDYFMDGELHLPYLLA